MRSSGIFSFERIRCRTVTPSVHGGGSVKIRVSRELLNPAGKEIAGILHINGTRVYIPRDGQISIGSARDCDIRIFDQLIEGQHILMISKEKGFEVTNLSVDRRLVVKVEGVKDIAELALGEENDLEIAESARLFLELGGIGGDKQKRLLEMKLEIIQRNVTEAVRELLETKPPITELVVAEAPAKIKKPVAADISIAMDRSLIGGTPFSEARTLDEAIDIFIKHREKYERDNKVLVMTRSGVALAGAILMIATGFPILFVLPLFGLGNFLAIELAGRKNDNYFNKITQEFAEVIRFANPSEIAGILSRRSKETRNLALVAINKDDSNKGKAIRAELDRLLSQAHQPPQLEPPKA